jgi:thiol-disulfide isomerase/thioredoxin
MYCFAGTHYLIVYCLSIYSIFLFPFLVHAQRYEERLRFLHEKLAELEEIERRAIDAQTQLARSAHARDKLYRDKWNDLELQSRKTLERVAELIKKLESYFFQSVIQKYTGEDPGVIHIDKSLVLTRLDGRRERIRAYRGRVVLLHFWATWCRPCLRELPALKAFYDRFDAKRFEILAISLDARGKDVHRFLLGKGLRFPIYLDPGRSIYRQVVGGLEVLPRSILLDKKGHVFKSYVGEQQWEAPHILRDVAGLLAAK